MVNTTETCSRYRLIKFVKGDGSMYGTFNMVYHNGINFTKIYSTVLLNTDHTHRLTEELRTKTTTF